MGTYTVALCPWVKRRLLLSHVLRCWYTFTWKRKYARTHTHARWMYETALTHTSAHTFYPHMTNTCKQKCFGCIRNGLLGWIGVFWHFAVLPCTHSTAATYIYGRRIWFVGKISALFTIALSFWIVRVEWIQSNWLDFCEAELEFPWREKW